MSNNQVIERQFDLGRVILCNDAERLAQRLGAEAIEAALTGHMLLDWGLISWEAKAVNDQALRDGHGVVVSIQRLEDGAEVFVTTDEAWSVTTVQTIHDAMEEAGAGPA